jgi:hypothetical protein
LCFCLCEILMINTNNKSSDEGVEPHSKGACPVQHPIPPTLATVSNDFS